MRLLIPALCCLSLSFLPRGSADTRPAECRLGMEHAAVLKSMGVPAEVWAGASAVGMRYGTADGRAIDVVLHEGVVVALLEVDSPPPPRRPLPLEGVHLGLPVDELAKRLPQAPDEVTLSSYAIELGFPSGARARLANGVLYSWTE